MGITKLSLDRLERSGALKEGVTMLELGAQNLYDTEHYGQVAKDYFKSLGIEHTSWDIIPHQGAKEVDLRKNIKVKKTFGVITNFGTIEHLDGGLYQGFENIHDHCELGGLMIHENPKTGNWPDHGQHYFTKNFFEQLAKENGYEVVELTEEAAMGNTKDGWNICAVLRKSADQKFMTEAKFKKLDVHVS